MTKKKKKTNKEDSISDQYRVCIDLKATGNAKGGEFITLKGLKDMVEDIESKGTHKMVGLVYDGTDELEILIQDLDNNSSIQKAIEGAEAVD